MLAAETLTDLDVYTVGAVLVPSLGELLAQPKNVNPLKLGVLLVVLAVIELIVPLYAHLDVALVV